MKIGELALRTSLAPSRIRFYERRRANYIRHCWGYLGCKS